MTGGRGFLLAGESGFRWCRQLVGICRNRLVAGRWFQTWGWGWSVRLLPVVCAVSLIGCVAPRPAVDLSLPGRVMPVVDGRIYPVAWRPLDHPPIVFDRGQVTLSEEQTAAVVSLAEKLRQEQGMLVMVGFGRDGWSEDHTRVLAEARALEVRRALLMAGLERERMQTVSVGRVPPPGWPASAVPPQAQGVGGWVLIGEMLIPLEAWLAAGGERLMEIEGE